MIRYESPQKKLPIAAMAGISMLLLVASCIAQESLETNGTGNCNCTCMNHQLGPGIEFGEKCEYSSIPDKAILISPKGAIYIKNPTFKWNPVKYCTKYCLKVARASQPDQFIFEKCYQAHEVLSDWACSVQPEELKDQLILHENYRWWIISSNCRGKSWSNYMEFVCDNDPQLSKPTPISPMGLVSAKTPEFKWTAVPGATKYNLQVIRGTTGKSIIVNAWFDAERVTREDICSAFSPVILPDDTYFWGVRAKNKDNYAPEQLNDKDLLYFENICALKPENASENLTEIEKEIGPEKKGTAKAEKEMIEAKRGMIEAKRGMIEAMKKKVIDLKGGNKLVCNCGSSN